MQIDFHHAVTYVTARVAGFNHEDANTIAHSAQYVDDATKEGVIKFKNGAKYSRIASAHKMLDYKNLDELDNHNIWVPFHFLPGNSGLPAGKNPDSFIRKMICEPNSSVSLDMVESCIGDANKPYGLHRLGISMHVYADTWSHFGFAGVKHEINRVDNLVMHNDKFDITEKLSSFWGDFMDKVTNAFVSDFVPLGHGAALECPDLPYLHWTYTNGLGEEVDRDNLVYCEAAVRTMITHMQNYRKSLGEEIDETSKEEDVNQMIENFKNFRSRNADERHEMWLKSIFGGDFNFGKQQLSYDAKGPSSWKFEALNIREDNENIKQGSKINDEIFEYHGNFLQSNWKLFHDALQAHHFDISRNILPKYGICIA